MSDLLVPQLTPEQARSLTDEAKEDSAALWMKLYALNEGNAHGALGYTNWRDYFAHEFGQSGTTGQHLLDAGRVRAELEQKVTIVTLPTHEGVARELSPVLHKAPDELVDVWTEAVATAKGDAPTAAEVRAVVDERVPHVRPKRRASSSHSKRTAQRELTDLLADADALLRSVCRRLQSGALVAESYAEDRIAWTKHLRRTAESIEMADAMIVRQTRESKQREKSQ
jgi:hypothetical protein